MHILARQCGPVFNGAALCSLFKGSKAEALLLTTASSEPLRGAQSCELLFGEGLNHQV